MYKAFTADDFRKHFSLPDDYTIDGFLVYGGFKKEFYDSLKDRVSAFGISAEYRYLERFLEPILEFTINKKRYWFTVAYGGTRLSEWLHLACMFGSKANILIGTCGGLIKGGKSGDIIVPTFSYGDESPTRTYSKTSDNKHYSDESLRKALARRLREKHTVFEGPTVTHQAMLGETWEDVLMWSKEGYYGVEMEAATVFAISNHFEVPSACAVVIGDNLIEEQTVMDVGYKTGKEFRDKVKDDLFDTAISELIGK